MKINILIGILVMLLLVSGAIALISNEYGEGIIKQDYTLYKGEVISKIELDTSFNSKNYTLDQFKNINLNTYDFKLNNEKEIIFDEEKNELFFIYTAITGEPIYHNETGNLDGMRSVKYEFKLKYPYNKFKSCRVSRSTEVCFDKTKVEIDKLANLKIEKLRERLLLIQNEANNILTEETEEVYDDFVNNLI